MHDQAVREYQQTRIETGSPVRLVSMLYDGALRFIAEASDAIEAGDIPLRADRIRRAANIIHELKNSLEYSVESDLPHRLATLYDYVDYELLEATTRNDVGPLNNAVRILNDLAQAWRQLAERYVEPELSPSENQHIAPPATPEEGVPATAAPSTYDEVEEHDPRGSLSLSA